VTVRVDASLTRAGSTALRLTDQTDWVEIRELVTES
jgi:hypothetical protein